MGHSGPWDLCFKLTWRAYVLQAISAALHAHHHIPTEFPGPGSSGRRLSGSPEQHSEDDNQLPKETGPLKMWVRFRMTRALSFAWRWLGASCAGAEVRGQLLGGQPRDLHTHTELARCTRAGSMPFRLNWSPQTTLKS